MYPVSNRYLDTLARSHDQTVYVEILKNGNVVSDLQVGKIFDTDTGAFVSAIDGSINVSSTTIRRSGSIQVLDAVGLFTPLDIGDIFSPFSTEIRIWVGVRYWDSPLPMIGVVGSATEPILSQNDIELVPVATFVVTGLQISNRVITLQGYDRMWMLDNFTSAYTIVKGVNVSDAIESLIRLKIPNSRLKVDLPDVEDIISATTVYDSNTTITDAIQNLATIGGYQVFCDPIGTFVGRSVPETNDPPELTLTPGQYSVMYRPERDIGSNAPINAVVFTNEGSTSPPVRGYAQDDNPKSMTNVASIGVRPMFMSSPIINTQDAVNKAAATALKNNLGVSDMVTVVMVPNHALDVNDVITVTDLSQGIDNLPVIIDNFSLPLRATSGTISVQCRTNVIV